MAYEVKNRNEFEQYLNNVKVIPSSDEVSIDNFNSSSLFDLYELLTKIKDDQQISLEMQKKLKTTLKTNFSEEVSSILSFPVTNDTLHGFEEYIKDVFLTYVKNGKNPNISEKEMENLKIIVAKKYPNEFLKFIKEEKNSAEFKLEKAFLAKTVLNVVDEYTQHTEKMQNNEDIQTATYTTSNNKFSKINTATTGRLKSPNSMKANLEKEFRNSLNHVIPSNLEKGITYTDLEDSFNLSKVSDDYYAFTVYITNIADTFHIDKEMKNTKDGKEFIKCREQKEKFLPIYHSLYDFLNDPFSFLNFTQEHYLQMRIELLNILQHLTYQEFSEEYAGPLFQPKNENDPRNFFFQASRILFNGISFSFKS